MPWSPIAVDRIWDEIDDDTKFRLWNFTSSRLFYGRDDDEFGPLCEELSAIMVQGGLTYHP